MQVLKALSRAPWHCTCRQLFSAQTRKLEIAKETVAKRDGKELPVEKEKEVESEGEEEPQEKEMNDQ